MATCRNTIFIALKRTRGYIVALEGSVAEYLFHMEDRTPAASHTFMSTLFLMIKMIKKYVV